MSAQWGGLGRKVEKFEELREESGRGCLDLVADCQIGRSNCGKASLLKRISEH